MSWRAGLHGYVAKWGVVTSSLSRRFGPDPLRPVPFERDCFSYATAGFGVDAMTLPHQGGVAFDSISKTWLTEISICPRGACPGAVCWHAAAEPWALRPHAAALAPGWEASRAMMRRAAQPDG